MVERPRDGVGGIVIVSEEFTLFKNQGTQILISHPVCLERINQLLEGDQPLVINELFNHTKRVDNVGDTETHRRGDYGIAATLCQGCRILDAIVEEEAGDLENIDISDIDLKDLENLDDVVEDEEIDVETEEIIEEEIIEDVEDLDELEEVVEEESTEEVEEDDS